MMRWHLLLSVALAAIVTASPIAAQEQSVKPGINDAFRSPDVEEFTERFETESREVYARRDQIVAACELQAGETVADIGAGTGLFTRLFAKAVGDEGRVIAVDIAQEFLEHIESTSRDAGLRNITTQLATADSARLPAESIDVAFICDTYHHFEFPLKTIESIHRALKPGGRVIVVDFRRVPGVSSDWVLNHVRAGQEVVEAEIEQAGFRKVREVEGLLEENYLVVFEKPASAEGPPRRGGARRGPPADVRADQAVFHYLLAHHTQIRRSVTKLDNGVETITESDEPEVARKIQEHVAAMHDRVKEGRGLRYWDELFAEIFRRHADIKMVVENTEKGVRVRATSDDPAVVALIQAHAEVISRFVKFGWEEAHRGHPVPQAASSR